jgi:hypothetical protein
MRTRNIRLRLPTWLKNPFPHQDREEKAYRKAFRDEPYPPDPCPRCEEPLPPHTGALSRAGLIEICSDCGVDEHRFYFEDEDEIILTPAEWPIVTPMAHGLTFLEAWDGCVPESWDDYGDPYDGLEDGDELEDE